MCIQRVQRCSAKERFQKMHIERFRDQRETPTEVKLRIRTCSTCMLSLSNHFYRFRRGHLPYPTYIIRDPRCLSLALTSEGTHSRQPSSPRYSGAHTKMRYKVCYIVLLVEVHPRTSENHPEGLKTLLRAPGAVKGVLRPFHGHSVGPYSKYARNFVNGRLKNDFKSQT